MTNKPRKGTGTIEMPIPGLNEHGLLPPGIHVCSLDEIQQRFGLFQGTDQRVRLFEQLALYVEHAKLARVAQAVVVDGSFITAKPNPGDVDILVALSGGWPAGPQRPSVYNAISKRKIRQNYPFDVFVAEDGDTDYVKIIQFFSQVKSCQGSTRVSCRWSYDQVRC